MLVQTDLKQCVNKNQELSSTSM